MALHAHFPSAAVFVADGEHASGHGRRQGLPIARRDESRGSARRRARAMIRDRDQNRVEELALGGFWNSTGLQEKDSVDERAITHQVRDVVAANPNSIHRDFLDEGGTPRLHVTRHYDAEAARRRESYRTETGAAS